MQERLFRSLSDSMRPLDLVAWADENRIMPEGSPRPGRWQTSYMPPARALMEAYSDPGVSEITLMSATQMLKTEFLFNIIYSSVLANPANVMYVTPDKDLAHSIAEARLRPGAEAMPLIGAAFESRVVLGRSRSSSWGEKTWPGGGLVMAWSEARSGLISRPVQIVLLDEVDRYVKTDVYESVRSRGVRYGLNFKLVSCSSPEDKVTSLIYRNYMLGSRGRFHGRCVYCGELDLMEWTKEKVFWEWDSNKLPIPATARYKCGNGKCGKLWTDDERARAIDAGEYVHEDDGNTSHRSFWVNRLADKHVSLEAIVDKARKAMSALHEMADVAPWRRFLMDDMAVPWDETARMIDPNDLNKRLLKPRQMDGKHVLPEDAEIVVVSVDVQDDRLEMDVGAWGWHEKAMTTRYWGLGYHKAYGEITGEVVWKYLDALLKQTWAREGRDPLGVSICMIDSQGHHTEEVKSYIARNAGKPVYPLKGYARTRNNTGIRVPDKPTEGWGATKQIQVGTNTIKDWVMSHALAETFDEKGDRVLEWYQNKDYDLKYFEGLVSSEEKVRVKREGKFVVVWQQKEKGGVRNEPLDLMVYSHAGMELYAYIRVTSVRATRLAPDWKDFYRQVHAFRKLQKAEREGKVVPFPGGDDEE